MKEKIPGINKVAVQQAIDVMERVIGRGSEVSMANWQTPLIDTENLDAEDLLCTDEMEMHNCGTAACFGGWIAVSPEWKAIGGLVDGSGGPLLEDVYRGSIFGSEAIAEWFKIENWRAELLTCTSIAIDGRSGYYGNKPLHCITAHDVVAKLKELLH